MCKLPRWPVFTMINYVTQGWLFGTKKTREKKEYTSPCELRNWHTSCPSAQHLPVKSYPHISRKQRLHVFFPGQVNAHADILDSPKAKRVLSVKSAQWVPALPSSVQAAAELPVWRGGPVRGEALGGQGGSSPSPLPSLFNVNSFRLLPFIPSLDLSWGHVE